MKSFKQLSNDRVNLMLVDSLNLSFRWKHRGDNNFAHAFLSTIQSLANSYNAKKVIVLGDGGSDWRKSVSPEYKQNRKDKYANQSEEEQKAFEDFMEGYKKALELTSTAYPVVKFKGVEADDLAAYLVKHYADFYEHTWLISTDKDWDLLVDENVSRFSYKSRAEIGLATWHRQYDYAPEHHIDIKVLTGDSGDNVKGIAGIGPGRAAQLVERYGSALDIYASLPLEGKQKFIQALNESGDLILDNFKLMDLLTYCDEIVTDEAKEMIGEIM